MCKKKWISAAALILGVTATVVIIGRKRAAKLGTSISVDSQQPEGQITLFKEAIDLLGPQSPDGAVLMWIKGNEAHNGSYKYAAADSRVKQQLIERWGAPEKSFWKIGAAGRELTSYEITERNSITEKAREFTVSYHWSTAAGASATTTEHLTVTKYWSSWCISKAESISGCS